MTSVILLLVFRDDKAEAALARYKRAMEAMPSFEVQVLAKNSKRPPITADMIVDGQNRFLYDATMPRGKFVLSITPSVYREVDYASKSYDETPPPGKLTLYSSRISKVPETIPFWLTLSDIHRLLQRGSQITYQGVQVVNGVSCDVVKSTFQTQMSKGYFDFDIAKSGLMIRQFRSIDTPEGHQELSWELKDYKPLKSISESRFENRIPDGFMPYALPDHDLPLEVGRKPNLSGWVDSAGHKWSPPSGRPMFFVIVGEDSPASARSLDAVRRWRQALSAKGISLVLASDSVSNKRPSVLLVDPDRKSVNSLNPPAVPMFYLIDSKGTLRNLWMGFGPEQESKFHTELLSAIQGLK